MRVVLVSKTVNMKTEKTSKTLLTLGLTVLLCIAFDCKSSAHGMAEMKSENRCYPRFFETISCSQINVIRIINALFGYSNCGECCPFVDSDCFISIPSYNFDYYQTILNKCNNTDECHPFANSTDADVFCHEELLQQSDYVRLEFICVPAYKTMKTATVCLNSSDFPISTTLSCAENESIAFVGAILGFQNSTEESCRPGEDRCRTQPDADHLNCIQALCHGRQNCTVAAADSAPADDTCSSFVYMYENITYYCADTKPTAPESLAETDCWFLYSTTAVTTTISTSTQVLSSPGTFFTSTLEPSTPMQANLTTITANTTSAKPEDEGDDDEDLDVIIGLSIACALTITAVIVGIAVMIIIRKRKFANLKLDNEYQTSYAEIENDGTTVTPQSTSNTQEGGQNGIQGPQNGDVIVANGVNKVYQGNVSLPNDRMNINSDDESGKNKQEDYSDAAIVKLSRVKALRASVDAGYDYIPKS